MNKQIIIIGGGFAGLMSAVRLSAKARRQPIDIILINASEDYIIRPRLHLWATNETRKRRKIVDVLKGTKVQFKQAWVTALSPESQQITCQSEAREEVIHYDELIYAIGSRTRVDGLAGVEEYTYKLNEYGENNAEDLRQKLLTYEGKQGRVIVVGGGATGLEGATQIKARYPQLEVSIISRNRLGSFKDDKRIENIIQNIVTEQDITIYNNVSVREVHQDKVLLSNGDTLPYDICVWAGGFSAPPLARDAGLQVNAINQVLIDPYQHVLGYNNITAVGDCAYPVEAPGNPYRMSFQVALTMGAHAADNMVRKLKGKQERPLSFAYYGQGIQLGDNGIGWMGFPDDRPHGMITTGGFALSMRNFFVSYMDYVFNIEKRFPGTFIWMGKNRYAKQQKQALKKQRV